MLPFGKLRVANLFTSANTAYAARAWLTPNARPNLLRKLRIHRNVIQNVAPLHFG